MILLRVRRGRDEYYGPFKHSYAAREYAMKMFGPGVKLSTHKLRQPLTEGEHGKEERKAEGTT